MRKIKAYTIPEIIVVMIISSILIISLWGAYSFIVNRFHDFNTTNENYENVMRLDMLLRNDFHKAHKITTSFGKQLDIEFSNHDKMSYIFEDNVIIRRNASNSESFYIRLVGKEMKYLYLERKMTSYLERFSAEIILNGRKIILCYNKSYDNKLLMNLNI